MATDDLKKRFEERIQARQSEMSQNSTKKKEEEGAKSSSTSSNSTVPVGSTGSAADDLKNRFAARIEERRSTFGAGQKNDDSFISNLLPGNNAVSPYKATAARVTSPVTGYKSGLGKKGWKSYAADLELQRTAAEASEEEKSWFERIIGYLGASPDSTLPMANATIAGDAYRKDTSYREPSDEWNDAERDIFGYLYENDREASWRYAEELNNAIANEKKQGQVKQIQEDAISNPVRDTAGALLTSPLGIADYLDALVESTARGTITEKGTVTPFEYSQAVTGGISQHLNDQYGTLNEDIPVIGGKGLGDAYGLGTSIAQSSLAALTGGSGQALISFFGSAAASGLDEAKQRGASDEQAIAYGTLAGAAESIAEMIGVDNLMKIGSSATMRQLMMNLVKQGASEGIEEGITTLLNNFSDQLVMQDKSNFNILVQQYMKQGLSESDAKKQAWKDMANDLAFDMVSGFVSGAVHAGPQTAYQTYLTGSEMRNTYGDSQRELVDKALEIDPENAYAQKMQERLDYGNDLRGGQLRKLVNQNEAAMTAQDMQSIQEAAAQRLTELGETENVEAVASALAKQAAGEKLSVAEQRAVKQSRYGQRVANELNAENIQSGGYASGWAEGIGTNIINAEAYGRMLEAAEKDQHTAPEPVESPVETVHANDQQVTSKLTSKDYQQVPDDGVTRQESTGKEVTPQKIVSIDGGKAMIQTDCGTIAVDDISFGTQDMDLLWRSATQFHGINPAGANGVIRAYRSGDNVATYLHGAAQEFQNGYYNLESGGEYADKLAPSQREIIYSLGQKAAGENIAKAQANAAASKKSAVTVSKMESVGKVHFDRQGRTFDQTREVSLKTMEQLSKALGVEFYVYESYRNDAGHLVYKDADGNEVHAPNGYYDRKDGSIHIDLNAGVDGKGTMLFTIAHELTHFINQWSPAKFKVLADFLVEQYGENGVSVNKLVDAQLAKAERNGREMSWEEAYEEVVADSMEAMLADGNVVQMMAELKQQDQTLWQKICDWFKDLVADLKAVVDAYKGVKPDSYEGKMVAQMQDVIVIMESVYADALADASENYQAAEQMDIEIDAGTESVSPTVAFSERTWTESDYVQEREKAAAEIAKAIGVSRKKAMAYIDSVNGIAKMIAEDRVRLDYFSSPGRSSFVSNVEYGGSFDFSTLCKKRRLLTGTFTAIQKALPNTALTANEILDIRNRMKDAGLEVSCGLCYVEGSRNNMGQFAKEFLKLYKQYYPDAWQPNMADVNTPDGIEWVRINHPECYEQYEYFWNHFGTLKPGDKNLFASQQKPKLYQLHTEYKGEILDKFKDDGNVEKKNLNGGIRLQSFSDFEIVHLIDTMQIIMDMSRVGLAGQAYTKVPDFAWALGDTGLKINLSLIAKGVDENGQLIFDDVEGMPIDEAMALRDRYSRDVGTILVAFNDEQLMAAMADDRVDFIIPFHRSQWKKSQYEAMGLPAKTKDYTYMQNEKFIKSQFHEYRGRMVRDRATNYMPNEYWDFSKSGKENAIAYLEMCARNNKRPKFYKLLQNNGDGSYSLKEDGSTDGYWKLLIDFKMYDNSGKGSPQTPVKPDFNMEEATRMLETYQGGHSNFPVAQGIVDDFVKEYKESHKGVKFSDRTEFADSHVKYSERVTDQEALTFLNNQKTIKTYKTMQVVDGKLYPPMAARTNGEYEDYSVLGEWEQATEHPELIKNGNKFKLDKGKGQGSIEAAYNPYMHSSNLVLNDQFSGAYTRDNLVTVECEVPVSETTSGYHAQYAKDSVGWHSWHTGTVAGGIRKAKGIERQVFLSRWIKPVRIVPDAEVATMYKDLLDGTDVAVPDNVVTPSLLKELKAAGVKIKESGRIKYSDRDSEGNQLSEDQVEFFANSKARDEDGNLYVMYHGSRSPLFTEFDMYEGVWLTPDQRYAEVYAEQWHRWRGDGENLTGLERSVYADPDYRLYKMYANITNPLDLGEINDEFDRGQMTRLAKLLGVTVSRIRSISHHDGYQTVGFVYEVTKDHQFIEIAKEKGYDGFIATEKGRKTFCAFNAPNQVKLTTNEVPSTFYDIRYSDRDPELEKVNQVLSKENAELKYDIAYLKELLKLQRQVTGGTKFTRSSVEAAAGHLMKYANARGDKRELAGLLNNVYEYIAGGKELTWGGVKEAAQPAVAWLKDNAATRKQRDSYAQDVLKEIRGSRVYLDEQQKEEVAYQYGSYNDFRKKAMGSVTLTDDSAVSLDTQWQEWSSLYPNIFDPEVSSNDMPAAMMEAFDRLRGMTEMDAYSYDDELFEQDLLSQVYDSYWNVSTLRTVADVKQKEINRIKHEHSKRMSNLRAFHKEKTAQLKAEHRESLDNVRQEARKQAEKKLQEQSQRYQESRKKGVENRRKTEMRRKIRRTIMDLNKILKRGDKKRNVKEDMKDLVAQALDSADVLFTDNYSNEDMVRNGVGTDLTEQEAKYLEEARELMEQIGNLPSGSYEAFQERHAQETKLQNQLSYRMSKLRDVFTRERARLAKAKVSEVLGSLADAYKGLEDSEYSYVSGAFHENVYQYLIDLKNEVGGTIVKDMSLNQLDSLHRAYTMVLTTVRNANKMFAANMKQTREQLGSQVINEVKLAGGEHGLWFPGEDKISAFSWNNQKPIYAFERIGSGTLTKLFENTRTGEDTWAQDMAEAREFYLDQVRKHKYDRWDFNKQYKFTSATGVDFSLNLEQIMSLYAYSKREQAHEHLMKGGFVFDGNTEVQVNKMGIKLTYLNKTAKAHNVSPDILGQIVSKLTADQKAFVDSMQDYLSSTMGEKGNSVSMELYGVKLFNEKHYFPLRSAGQYMERAKEADLKKQQGQISIVNSGFAKSTTPKASNPVVLSGFMDVWADHVNEMSMYHSFVLPMEDFRRVYNYASPNQETGQSVSVNSTIQNAYGEAATNYIDQLYRDLNGGAVSDPRETTAKSLMGKFKKAAVFASASVVVQQPSAIGRSFAIIDPKYFVGGRVGAKRYNALWAELKKYAPVAAIKEMGYFDTGMGKSAKDYIKGKEYKGIKEKAAAIFTDGDYRDELLGKAPALADELTWCAIWDAAKRETKAKNPRMDVKSEEFLTKAGRRFTEVIVKTQVYDSVLSRSANMRSKGAFMSMWTAFMAEPTTTINMMEDALRKAKKGDKRYAARAIGAVLSSIILNSALASLVYAMRDDDEDETFLEKYAQSFATEILDGINPLTYYPFLKDVWSALQGFDIERSDMSLITSLAEKATKLVQAYGKDTDGMDEEELAAHGKEIANAWWGVVDYLTAVVGIPVKNVRRDINGAFSAYSTISADLTDRDTSWGSLTDKVLGEVKNSIPVIGWLPDKTAADRLYEATVGGDTAYQKRLASSYKTEESLNNAICKGLRANDSRIWEAAMAWNNNDLAGYMRIAKEIVGEGKFSQDNVVAAIQAEAKAMLPKESEDSEGKAKGYFTAEKFAVAISQGNSSMAATIRADIIATAQLNGKTQEEAEKIFASSAKSKVEDLFQAGSISTQRAIKALTDYCGKTQEEATEAVAKWSAEKDTGIVYNDIDDAFLAGDITEDKARRMYMTYGGYSEEKATEKVGSLAFERDYPELSDRITYTQYKRWQADGEPNGVDIEVFTDVAEFRDDGTSGSTKSQDEVAAYINSLPVSTAQKDALWCCFWKASTLKKAPWH